MPLRSSSLAYPGALAGAWRVCACAWLALVATAMARWVTALLEIDPRDALAASVAVGLLVAGLAARALPRGARLLCLHDDRWTVSGSVSRDGVAATPLAGRPALALDLGRWLLVRFDAGPSSRPLWLPLSSASEPAAWPALRAALWTWRPAASPGRAPADAPTR